MAKQSKKKSSRSGKAQSSDNRTLLIALAVVGVLAVAGLGYLLWRSLQPEPEITGVVTFPRLTRGHETNLEIPFGELPPAGGVHDPVWQNCGTYDEPIGTQHAIHALEHGALWITYRNDLNDEQVTALQDKFRGQTYTLISPYPEQRSPYVLTAWGVQLEVDDLSDQRVDQFVERYRLGPNTPERGAACTGGIGEPIS